MKIISILKSVLALTVIVSCSNNNEILKKKINYTDTLYQTKILSIDNKDTIKEIHKVYFSPTNSNIDTSNFFYEACKEPCDEKNLYKVFFSRAEVIMFCDSFLTTFPVFKNKFEDENFFEKLDYENIKEQASKNKMNETMSMDQLGILLERFHPFITNLPFTNKPSYVIIDEYETQGGGKYQNYLFKVNNGDTILITSKIIRVPKYQLKAVE